MDRSPSRRPLIISLIGLTLVSLACTAAGVSNVEATANAAEQTVQAAVTQNVGKVTPQDFQATDVAATVLAINVQQTLTAQPLHPLATITAAAPPPEASPTPTATEPPAPPTDGIVMGKVCYPAGGIPPLTIYLKPLIGDQVFHIDNPADMSSYQIKVPGGNYVAFSYPTTAFDPADSLVGGYTQMVPCGLTASCTDHTLIEFAVNPGVVTSGIDVCDWYAPAGTLPPRP